MAKFNKIQTAELDDKDTRVILSGNTLEVAQMAVEPNIQDRIRKIDRDYYVFLETGELCKYDHDKEKTSHWTNIQKTIHKIRWLINHNFQAGDTFITLTYAQPDGKPMRDTKKLQEDMDTYLKALRRRIKPLKYLYVVEPQETGSWHTHLIISGKHDVDYIKLWPHGEPWCQKIEYMDEITNIGAYVSAYLTSLKEGQKGSRLHFYPEYMKIYRHSQNVVFPPILKLSGDEIKKIVGDISPDYSETILVSDDSDNLVQSIKRLYYNMSESKKSNVVSRIKKGETTK